MEGLGPKILDRLIEEGIINNFAELFDITVHDIENLSGFGKVSALNIVETISNHKRTTLVRLLFALGIRNVGLETAREIARWVLSKSNSPSITINQIIAIATHASLDEWKNLPDVGPVVAQSIYDYFHTPKNLQFFRQLQSKGVAIITDDVSTTEHKPNISGKTFVFTGTLTRCSRDKTKEIVRLYGGETSEAVSKQTDYLIAGEKPGSKLDHAKTLNIPILTEQQFINLFHFHFKNEGV